MSFFGSMTARLTTPLSSPSRRGSNLPTPQPTPRPTPTQLRAQQLRKAEPWIMWVFNIGFIICGIASGYATFSGIRLFLDEIGGTTFIINGTAVILTIAVSTILTTGWAVIVKWGPEAPSSFLRSCMVLLGTLLFAITLSVSSLSNLMTLAGPAAKVYDWRQTHRLAAAHINKVERRSLGVQTIKPLWLAERNKACSAAGLELDGGLVSGSGRGSGPVASALQGICELTKSFISSIDEAVVTTDQAALTARGSLAAMRLAIRDRSRLVIEREDQFLDAGDRLNAALQKIGSADLTKALDVGAEQVAASVAALSKDSVFSRKQVEAVASIRQSLTGLVAATKTLSRDLRKDGVSEFEPVDSPDFIAAIFAHAPRFVPVFAAAIGIDTFMLWALGFMLVHKAGYRFGEKRQSGAPRRGTKSRARKPAARRRNARSAKAAAAGRSRSSSNRKSKTQA